MNRTFDATDEKLYEVIAFVEEGLDEHGADMKSAMAITVALEEIFVNIAHYAYPGSKGKVDVAVTFDGDSIEIRFTDDGMPFDPLMREDPDINAGIEEREVGGLGIYLVKKTMDECHYERKDGKNIFTMKRKIRND